MRIAFFCDGLSGYGGGLGKVTSIIADQFSRDNEVMIIGNKNDLGLYNINSRIKTMYFNRNEYISNGIWERGIRGLNWYTNLFDNIYGTKILLKAKFSKALMNKYYEIIKCERIDCVIAVAGTYTLDLAMVKKNHRDIDVIGWQHNSYDSYFNSKRRYLWHQKRLFQYLYPYLNKYIVLSENDKKEFAKAGLNVKVIRNPRSFVSAEKAELMGKQIIAAGGLRTAKGFDLLIDSFSKFHDKNKEWKLLIYGDGDDRRKLEKLVEEKGMKGYIKMPGSTNNIKAEMLKSSFFVLPSRWEGMPMVILEALEVGLPIVAYDIPAVSDIIEDGVHGFIVPKFHVKRFAECMDRIANDYELRCKLAKNCINKAKEYSIDVIFPIWKEIVDNLR